MTTEMKDSGVKWIGSVPADWEINKIKYIATLKGRIGWQGLTSDEYTDEGAYLITGTDFENGGINWDSCVHVPMRRWEEARDIQIEDGDLLITKDGTIGKVAIVSGCTAPTSLNSGVLRISTIDGYDRKFLYWVLQSDVFWTWFADKNAGNSTIQHLYQGDFAEFKYAIPPIDEQGIIATLLDSKCSKVDHICIDLEMQIKLLKRYKKAVISHAVTKGLDASAPMKETDIGYIDKMPSHWDAKRMKYILATPLQYGANETGDEYNEDWPRYIRITDITEDNELKDDGKQSLPPDIAKPYLLKDGDVLFARSGATVGKTFYYTSDCGVAAFAGYLIKAQTNHKKVLPKFLYYSTLSTGYENWKNMVFTQATIQNIGADKYSQFIVTIPPLDEQVTIVDYLNSECGKIDRILAAKTAQLETMKRHKQSLIYEYVTGKKRVKEVLSHAN